MLPILVHHRVSSALLGYVDLQCDNCGTVEAFRLFLVSEAEGVYGIELKSSDSRVAFCDFCGWRVDGPVTAGLPIRPQFRPDRDHTGQVGALITSACQSRVLREPAGFGMGLGGLMGAAIGSALGYGWYVVDGDPEKGAFIYAFGIALIGAVVGLFAGGLWWTRRRHRRRVKDQVRYALEAYSISPAAWAEAVKGNRCPRWLGKIVAHPA
jgi:hypothetical protein